MLWRGLSLTIEPFFKKKTTMAASSFTFFASYYEALRYLPDDGCGKMLKAMCEYVFSDTEPQFSDPTQQGYWTLIKPILNRSIERSKAGRQGGNNGLGVSRNIGNNNASKSIANPEQIKSKTKQERNGIGVEKEINIIRKIKIKTQIIMKIKIIIKIMTKKKTMNMIFWKVLD